MRFSTLPLPLLGLLLLPAAQTAATTTTTTTTTITIQIPASHLLPNPFALPPSTHATLSALGASLAVPLGATNAFVFRNVSRGSYLADVHCATHAFAPLRIDVVDYPGGAGQKKSSEKEVVEDGGLRVQVWETFRGNDWANKGEAVAVELDGTGSRLAARVLGAKSYFVERPSFSVFSILRSPMILLMIVSMGIFLGMPYLMNNMDPEMRAEFEERQRGNPMNSLLSGGAQPGVNPMGNFDMAAFLAGSSSKKDEGGAAASGNGAGGSGGGGKKGQGVRR